jgi:hypothetical protein
VEERCWRCSSSSSSSSSSISISISISSSSSSSKIFVQDFLVGQHEGKKQLGRPWSGWKDNIATNLVEL